MGSNELQEVPVDLDFPKLHWLEYNSQKKRPYLVHGDTHSFNTVDQCVGYLQVKTADPAAASAAGTEAAATSDLSPKEVGEGVRPVCSAEWGLLSLTSSLGLTGRGICSTLLPKFQMAVPKTSEKDCEEASGKSNFCDCHQSLKPASGGAAEEEAAACGADGFEGGGSVAAKGSGGGTSTLSFSLWVLALPWAGLLFLHRPPPPLHSDSDPSLRMTRLAGGSGDRSRP